MAAATPIERERYGDDYANRRAPATRAESVPSPMPIPDEVITLYYDTYANLAARGVLPSRVARTYPPKAFPGPFVPDPPGGRRRR